MAFHHHPLAHLGHGVGQQRIEGGGRRAAEFDQFMSGGGAGSGGGHGILRLSQCLVPAAQMTLRVQCTKAKRPRIWRVSRAFARHQRRQIATKLTNSRFHRSDTAARYPLPLARREPVHAPHKFRYRSTGCTDCSPRFRCAPASSCWRSSRWSASSPTGSLIFPANSDVGTAFETVKHSAALADASRDFKSAVAAMRITVKDFSANPSDDLVISFAAGARACGAKPRHHRRYDRSPPCRRASTGLHKESHGAARYLHRPGAAAENPRLRRRLGLARQSSRCRQRGRTHHQREHDVAGGSGRRQIDDGAAEHAGITKPNIGSIKAS